MIRLVHSDCPHSSGPLVSSPWSATGRHWSASVDRARRGSPPPRLVLCSSEAPARHRRSIHSSLCGFPWCRALTAAAPTHTRLVSPLSPVRMNRHPFYRGKSLVHRSHIGCCLPTIIQLPHTVKFMGVVRVTATHSPLRHTGKQLGREKALYTFTKRKYSAYSTIKGKKGIPQYFNITRKCK